MNIDYKFIKKKVKCLLKENGIVDKEKIDEFTETCNDDYNLGLENGLSETEAFNNALRMLDDSIEVKRYNKHSFIFRISIIFFVSSVILSMVGWLIADVLTIYGVLYPICFILSLIMIVYTLITYKKRSKYEFIASTIIVLTSLSLLVQAIMFFYRARTGNFYYTLDYSFPGLLSFNTHYLVSIDTMKYELGSTQTLFDSSLIISSLIFVCSLSLQIKDRRKIKCHY